MQFGIFDQLPRGTEQTSTTRYREFIQQCTIADTAGFDSVWMAEYHFNPRFSVMPSPLLVGAAVARSTSNICIGTAVNLLPLHHPVRLAEEVATLDIISGGRVLFGVGRGSNPEHYSGLSVDVDEARSRFLEGLQIVKASWSDKNLNHEGQYYYIQDLAVEPKPIQKPYPPIYVAANSVDTFPIVGELGHNILVTPLIIGTQGVVENLSVYRKSLEDNGHSLENVQIIPTLAACVSESRNKSREVLGASIDNYLSVLKSGQSRRSSRALELTSEVILNDYAIVGDPKECIDRIEQLKESMGCQGVLFWQNIGGLVPHEDLKRSMELFSNKVLPHFR